MTPRQVTLGVFGAPHGVRGEVRLKSFTADPLAILRYTDLAFGDGRPVRLLSGRSVGGDMLVVKVAGVSDREAAKRLSRQELKLPREALPDLAEADEFYHADLIGLRAETPSGESLGVVTALHSFGGGDVIELRPEHGPSRLYPFTRAVVPQIDLAGGRLVLVEPNEIEARPDKPKSPKKSDSSDANIGE